MAHHVIQHIWDDLCMEPTNFPMLETLHIAFILEQVARGYLTGANCNRWWQHVFGNQQQPTDGNVLTFFYLFEFQSQGTLHLHMLVWVKDLSLIKAKLLHSSIPWNDAFLVLDTQQSSSSCLPLCSATDSFIQRPDGPLHLQFQYTEEDSSRNPQAYVRTLHGALRCRKDVQLADSRNMSRPT